jgi:nucleotide-binding universal stress UspA family protein
VPSSRETETEAASQRDQLLAGWRDKYPGVEVSQEVMHSHPGRALAGLSAQADLVILGRHSPHHGVRGPGAVTHAVLNHAQGPIATVPSP